MQATLLLRYLVHLILRADAVQHAEGGEQLEHKGGGGLG